jgi:hypothetical protein
MAVRLNLLPGVPEDYVRRRLSHAGGRELDGKFFSPDSSAALAVNAFAWFHAWPQLLPSLPGTERAGWPATSVEVEYCARFPWAGGRHPWLDACVVTGTHFIGVESKRNEPFRDLKHVSLSPAYDRPVWGNRMKPFEKMRDRLRTGELRFTHVDAAQLVKHAFGLVTDAARVKGKRPILAYLYDEPARWPADDIARNREELERFAWAVLGAAVMFVPISWHEWLARWSQSPHEAVRTHGQRLRQRFDIGSQGTVGSRQSRAGISRPREARPR